MDGETTHQTVGWLIALLKQHDPNIQVRFATSPSDTSYLLSEYLSDDGKILWIDVGYES